DWKSVLKKPSPTNGRVSPDQVPALESAPDHFDAKVSALIRDVPVPGDLASRLLMELQHTNGSQSAATSALGATVVPLSPPQPDSARSGNRWRLASIAATGICIAACVVGAWFLTGPRPTIPLEDLVQEAVADETTAAALPVLTSFADGSQPVLPATMKTRS